MVPLLVLNVLYWLKLTAVSTVLLAGTVQASFDFQLAIVIDTGVHSIHTVVLNTDNKETVHVYRTIPPMEINTSYIMTSIQTVKKATHKK